MQKLRVYLNKRNFYAFFFIISASVISYFLMFLIFPDLFLKQNFSFIRFEDTEHNYYGIFTFLSNFYHGGIQLWNNYDQMPLAYYYLSGGLTAWANLLTAFVYVLFHRFWISPAESYFSIFTLFYHIPSIFIRSVGVYLLVRRLTNNNLVTYMAMILINTVLAPQFYMGLNSTSLFSFFLILIYFILKFFEKFKLSDFLLALLTMTVCVAIDAELALGYFYQGVHFVILPIIIWSLVIHRSLLGGVLPALKAKIRNIDRTATFKIISVVSLCIVLMIPWVYMLKENYHDYSFNTPTTRFDNLNLLDFGAYFTRATYNAPQEQLFNRIVNFDLNDWGYTWVFLGYTAFFLTLCGAILSRDSRKYNFIGAIVFFWLINSPRISSGWQSIVHWINSITNPFNVAVRSFHMTGAFLLPFILLPLMALGFSALISPSEDDQNISHMKAGALFLLSIIFFYYVNRFTSISSLVRAYLQVSLFLSLVIIFLWWRAKISGEWGRKIIFGILIILFVFDGYGMSRYVRAVSQNVEITQHKVSESSLSVFLDYQNPEVLPLRKFYNTQSLPTVSGYIKVNPNNMQGLFYRYTNLEKYFTQGDIYKPRHISYDKLAFDANLQKYVQDDLHLISSAAIGVRQEEGMLKRIIDNHLEQEVILVDTNQVKDNLLTDSLPNNLVANKNSINDLKTQEAVFHFNQGRTIIRNGLRYYLFPLPKKFPSYLTTGIFTNDIDNLSVSVSGKEFNPAQGALIHPFTFDVGNFATNTLSLGVPIDYDVSQKDVRLKYPDRYSSNISAIWRNEADNLGFDYEADSNKWLIFHEPYDTKWSIKIDGKAQKIYRVNYSFIGVPVNVGTHKILLSYWPDTPLRPLMAVSIGLIVILPFVIMFLAIDGENEERKITYG